MKKDTHVKTLFMKEAIKKLKTHGSVFPSSSFLCRRMLQPIIMDDGVIIVELGAGTGAFTREIIRRLPRNGKLLVFEINHSQAVFLRDTFKDDRVSIIEDDAINIGIYLKKQGLAKADYIISGLPLGNFNKAKEMAILEASSDHLKDDGIFMQFQYFLQSWLLIRKYFRTKILCYEYRNIPPAFVYECRKKVL